MLLPFCTPFDNPLAHFHFPRSPLPPRFGLSAFPLLIFRAFSFCPTGKDYSPRTLLFNVQGVPSFSDFPNPSLLCFTVFRPLFTQSLSSDELRALNPPPPFRPFFLNSHTPSSQRPPLAMFLFFSATLAIPPYGIQSPP